MYKYNWFILKTKKDLKLIYKLHLVIKTLLGKYEFVNYKALKHSAKS